MDKNIINIDQFFIKAGVENGVCPLNWLAEFYREFPGKLVILDKALVSYLLNQSHCDKIEETEHDGYVQSFNLVWNATEEYPETRVKLVSYGRTPIEKDEKYNVESEANYYVIEELQAEDILVNGLQYAENMLDDRQMLFLVLKQPEKQNERQM